MAHKALVVLAHPGAQSLSRLFAEDAAAALQSRGADTALLDLYAAGFAPALTPAERAAYYGEQREHSGITEDARLLTEAETLVLVFPTWWFGMPAILKGWIDRVFAPGIAFDHASDFGPIKARLTNLKSVLIITTLGSPAWIDWLVMRRPVRRILKTAIFGLCAPQAKFKMLSLYAAENPAPQRINAFEEKITDALSKP
jgi:NAD(P)H dehydrogenase (quinone)